MAEPDQGLCVCFLAATPLHFHLQTRSGFLARHLAARGLEVRFVAPPTPRAMLRHWLRPWRERWAGAIRLIWPLPVPPGRWQMRAGLLDRIARWQAAWIRPQLETALPRVLCVSSPIWVPLLPYLSAAGLVYDCLDDPLVHARPGAEQLYRTWHHTLAQRADLIIAVSENLAAALRKLTTKPVMVCGNGVDAETFFGASASPNRPPRDTEPSPAAADWLRWRRANPQARVAGFVGSVDRWVDTDLLARTARALPEIHFLIAGPVRYRALAEPLADRPNVRLLGALPYAAVPTVISSLDVGLIPFRPGDISQCADPIKVYEYSALGKPVVSSVRFGLDDPEAPVVVAEDPAAFAAAIVAALADDTPAARSRRVAFARRHDWEARAETFLAAVRQVVPQ